jgi:BirA family biotin operon repressor/biotin-[acetyl-CoA-carboxylase] ligase
MIGEDFKPEIHRFDVLDSTNTKMKELVTKGVSEGAVVVAAEQTGGRGRGKRVWHSPAGGLYFSTLLYPRDSKHVTDLPILAGAAVAQAVKDLLPKHKDVSVKWPNDCLIGWKKVGGILCENLGEERLGLCVIGIGLNVNIPIEALEPFKENPFSATSFLSETSGGQFELDKVLDVVTKKLFTLYRLYQKEGFGPIKFLWEKNCKFIGKKIELRDSGWRESDRKMGGPGLTVGTFLGIDETGAIVLSNQKGEYHHYYTGEISCFWP